MAPRHWLSGRIGAACASRGQDQCVTPRAVGKSVLCVTPVVAKIRHVTSALHSLDDALGNAPRKDRRGRRIFADFRCLATVKAILPSTMRLLSSGLRDKELHCVRRSGCRLGSHSQPDANESSSCMTRPYLAAPLCREGTNDCWEGEFPRSGGTGTRGSLSLSAGTFVSVQTRVQNQSIHP